MGGGSQPTGNTTTTQTSSPWEPAQPYILQGLSSAQNLYNQNPLGPAYYPGQQVAQLNQQEMTPLTEQWNQGTAGGDSALQNAVGSNAGISSGSQIGSNYGNASLMPAASGSEASANNPYFQQMAATTLGATMPGISASFDNGNRLDSGLATRAASLGANDAIGNLAYQNYQQGLQNQITAGTQLSNNAQNEQTNQVRANALAPTLDQSQMQDYTTAASGLGGALQNQNQQNINAAVNQWNYQQAQPYNALSIYDQGIGGAGALGGTSTTTSPYFTNSGANIASGLTGGAALAGGLFGNNGLFSGAGSALLGLFGA